ncbi:hypothetical protein ACQUQP_17255 [Marinobacterium sp. YM272]|uniref:hypothetical protein n=1 Tax=Marinobacterium sp. YM272 TaxID=3421654 RepID=UPI003D7F429B
MPNRSTRWSIKQGHPAQITSSLLALTVVSAPLVAAEITPRLAERYASEINYAVVTPGEPRALPPVTVVAPSDPPPVHEVVVAPDAGVQISGEDLVFARIMQQEAELGCKPGEPCMVPLEPDITDPPGESLTPEAPFGTRRSVIEL